MTPATRTILDSKKGSSGSGREFVSSQELRKSSVNVYMNEVPAFLDKEMERLYQSIFSSSIPFRNNGMDSTINTYVTKKDEEIISILLFKVEDTQVRVLNELVALDASEIENFISYIFTNFPSVGSILFKAIETGKLKLVRPYQRYNCTEDIVIALPDSSQEYHASLGKNMRKTIKQYSGKIQRDFRSFDYLVLEGEAIKEEHILKVVDFNRARMSGKNKVPGVAEDESKWLLDSVRSFDGMVVLAMIDDRICAGQVCCRAGDHYFMLAVGHDPELDNYRLGTHCQYRAICEVIERGGKKCHFLWGREDYKYRFLGEQHDFDELIVFRSPLHMARHGRLVFKTTMAGRSRQARLWLLDPKRKDHFAIKLAKKTVSHLRGQMH